MQPAEVLLAADADGSYKNKNKKTTERNEAKRVKTKTAGQ